MGQALISLRTRPKLLLKRCQDIWTIGLLVLRLADCCSTKDSRQLLLHLFLLILLLYFLSLHRSLVERTSRYRCFPISEARLSFVDKSFNLLEIRLYLIRWPLLVEDIASHLALPIIHVVFIL